MNVHIYALRDPRDGAVRYIGATKDPQDRVRRHLSQHNRRVYREWLGPLRELGLAPEFETLEQVEESLWTEREKFWLQQHLTQGARLLNSRDGGGGGTRNVGRERTEEHCRNLSQALMGHPVSQETRDRISRTKASRTYNYPKGQAKGITTFNKNKTHCYLGHPFDQENTLYTRKGHRKCRTCTNERQNARYRERTALKRSNT